MGANRIFACIALRMGLFAATAVLLVGVVALAMPGDVAEPEVLVLGLLVLPLLTGALATLPMAGQALEMRRTTEQLRDDSTPHPEFRTGVPPAAELVVAVAELGKRLGASLSRHRLARIQAEHDSRLETEFLNDMSHELRTPLNAILGFSQVLLDEIEGPLTESQREDVETISRSGEHLRALVDDVIDFAALQSSNVTLRAEEVNLVPLLSEVRRLLLGQLRQKPVDIRVVTPDGPLMAVVDLKRLRQILMNLSTNALKFTDEGWISIEVAEEGSDVHIRVQDTGPGIPASDLNSIFEEFIQSTEMVRKSQGTGLGLAICRRLTELHGGQIWAESVVGDGSVFHVVLPRAGRP